MKIKNDLPLTEEDVRQEFVYEPPPFMLGYGSVGYPTQMSDPSYTDEGMARLGRPARMARMAPASICAGPYVSQETVASHVQSVVACLQVISETHPSRELSLAITKAEEMSFWYLRSLND